ncbi:uncharacterized protein EI90DRAFT_3154752 [Cantharellus anzutake]|uniref:uncharacterized protein n=1 Tax=Cantharellus anzutake TaxID=1750568 RepID=UPI001902D580|nr:uncharacterized protein EI90DRAFT_3154752 [Cantharellus anzutake]KAF8331103.1 hypothetical protein EI90DRAFT_3154752 [Cantharellus anzutake]
MSTVDRPLVLHISALSPDEYGLFTSVLRELAGPGQDDDSWDRPVDVMEARGWIRGRYGLDAALVDKILRYFPITPEMSDTLSAGQFFAVMRLVAHAQSGRDPAKTLVFVQASVPPPLEGHSSGAPRKHSFNAQKFSPSKPTHTPAQPPPVRSRGPSDATIHPNEGKPPNQPKNGNPFRRSASVASAPSASTIIPPTPDEPLPAPPMHPLSRLSAAAIETMSVSRSDPSEANHATQFGQRHTVGTKASASSPYNIPPIPPLPPRKPPNLPPRTSGDSLFVVSPSLPPRPPKVSPKPQNLAAPPIATSQLMKESLKAAKGGQIQKANEALLGKTLNLEVIGRSSAKESAGSISPFASALASSSSSSTNVPFKGVLRRSPSPPAKRRTVPTPPESVTSFENIAVARVSNARSPPNGLEIKNGATSSKSSSPHSSLSVSPSRRVHLLPPLYQYSSADPDPTNEPSTDVDVPISHTNKMSPTLVGRSKSLHGTPSPKTPLPPPPRRRPESVQVLGVGTSPFSAAPSNIASPVPTSITRRASLQSHSPSSRAPISQSPPLPPSQPADAFQSLYESVRKKTDPIQHSITDGFDIVRKKAESKLVPGGFMRRGAGTEGRGLFDDPESDAQESSADERTRSLSVDSLSIDQPSMDDDEWGERGSGREQNATANGWRRL